MEHVWHHRKLKIGRSGVAPFLPASVPSPYSTVSRFHRNFMVWFHLFMNACPVRIRQAARAYHTANVVLLLKMYAKSTPKNSSRWFEVRKRRASVSSTDRQTLWQDVFSTEIVYCSAP